MENMNELIEKLNLNRVALIIRNFDQQLKEILEVDLKTYSTQNGSNAGNQNIMAS